MIVTLVVLIVGWILLAVFGAMRESQYAPAYWTVLTIGSALFVLVRKATPDKVLEGLKQFKGKVLKTSLTADKEAKLREVLERA